MFPHVCDHYFLVSLYLTINLYVPYIQISSFHSFLGASLKITCIELPFNSWILFSTESIVYSLEDFVYSFINR